MRGFLVTLVAAACCTLSPALADEGNHAAAHRLAQQFAEADKPTSERPSLDYEMEMLRRARLEETARKKRYAIDATNIEAEPRTSTPEAIEAQSPAFILPSKNAKTEELSTAPTNSVNSLRSDATVRAVKTDKRIPVVKSREAASTAKVAARPMIPASKVVKKREPSTFSAPVERVAIMIVFADEQRPRDPIICTTQTCFIARGIEDAALALNKRSAFSLGSSRDVSDDPCWRKSACVFRNVPVRESDLFKVFDLTETKRDTSGQDYAIDPDGTCVFQGGRLGCGAPLQTSEFRMWIVPEFLAERAGGLAIENAVAYGLPRGGIKPIYVDK